MRIGIVSDTHNNLKNCRLIVELFNNAAVDQVIHTGDITQAKTIEVFSRLDAPMSGVFGNNDMERDSLEAAITRYDFRFVDPPLTLSLVGRELIVVHDPLDLDAIDAGNVDVMLHGHTHTQTIKISDSRLTFNPGESAGMMSGLNSIGIVDLGTLKPEVIRF
jgi:uncharacterized protein